jgi:hypothetical protein
VNTTFSIDASGSYGAGSYASSEGSGTIPAGSFSVSTSGMVTKSGLSSFMGSMSQDKNLTQLSHLAKTHNIL